MKKFLRCHVLPVICALSILISLCVLPASAAWDPDDYVDDDSVTQIQSRMNIPPGWTVEVSVPLLARLDIDLSSSATNMAWKTIDTIVNGGGTGEVSLPQLETIASQYTTYFNHSPADNFMLQLAVGTADILTNATSYLLFGKIGLTFEVRSWGTSGYKRIYCPELDIFVTSSTGRYAYANEAHLETSGGAKWVPLSTMADKNTKYHQLSELQLRNTASELGYKPIKYAGYWIIKKSNASGTTDLVYADPEGHPYVAPYNANEWATSTSRPTTSVKDENGDTVEDIPENSSANIDLSGMTVTLPDGTFNFIDQLLYDESTKTYYIDSHDTYTTENNYYITNNYSWTYHINYTSITYIGQTAEYDKYYEVYYELPDGRDSADLTKEEVEQLNVGVDVIPYCRSADDTSLRSLYHFDGDTKDSSYWNYCTDFTWNKGASLTYMDAGVFNGALYLDETEHDFTLTLPSSIGVGDFTLQFRYYQSYTAAPQTDSYIKLGGFTAMKLNGSSFVAFDDTVLSSTPIGSWNELALIRTDGTLYYYLNGVSIGSSVCSTIFSNSITFHFGADQQTYKYFDELRFLNYALVSDGENYECTSVPHDTNLTLVLPDSSVPIADEYWIIKNDGQENLLSQWNLDQWIDFDGSDQLYKSTAEPTYSSPVWSASFDADSYHRYNHSQYNFAYYSSFTNIITDSTGSSLSGISYTNNGQVIPTIAAQVNSQCYYPTCGIFSLIGTATRSYDSGSKTYLYKPTKNYLVAGTYTLSMVASDGSIGSGTFTIPKLNSTGNACWAQCLNNFNGYSIGVQECLTSDTSVRFYLHIAPMALNTDNRFVYLELVEGDHTDLIAEWVESVTVMDKDDLNTPTLAVRTDLDITSYQIGGVRPSLPTKGQVWALVENERITSIQIYNGSAWEGVDGRIWTGERWIPASSYNIITLQDMYDIADATQDFEYIYSESGFWTWWQKSWNAFTEKLFSVLGSGGSGGTSITPSSVKDALSQALSSLIESIFGLITEVLKSLIGAAMDLISGMFGFLSETVLGGISGFFDALEELVNPFESTVTDEDGSSSTVIALPDDISTVFAFFSGLFMVLPEQLRIILFFGIGFMLVLAVFKLIRA